MFIVSRKCEESVIIDGFNNPKRELKVTVMEVKGGRVILSFEVNADAAAHPARGREIAFHGNVLDREMRDTDALSA